MPATTVFWPTDIKHSGYCYGWTSPVYCVAGVLEVESEEAANLLLRRARENAQWKALEESCIGPPLLLGTCDISSARKKEPTFPLLKFWDQTKVNDYIVIFYHRHESKTLRFYSLDTLKLDPTYQEEPQSSAYEDISRFDFTIPGKPEYSRGLDDTVVNQFNYAKFLEILMQDSSNPGYFLPATASIIITIASLSTKISRPMIFVFYKLAALGNINLSIPSISPAILFKDVSATIQQLDVRAEQAMFFASEVQYLRHRDSTPIATYSARYTNFFNSVWLILNDITMGVAFGAFLRENNVVLSEMINHTIDRVLIRWIQWVLGWLNSWPAGLKLNTELSWFYSRTFIDIVETWGHALQIITPHSARIVYIFGTLSTWLGMTMAVSLFMDLLSILTMHIFICYSISGAVYRRMLVTAGSLWNLFRGKRYNVLRNRTDSWEYDIDQLLFGTMLFTLLAFLFPTVLVYYALFALLRLGTLLLQASMETLVAFMNHFPLFALMQRVKDPWRLPGGIYFKLKTVPDLLHPLMIIENQPIPLSSIFFQYIKLWSRLARHYNPLRLLYRVLSGSYLAAIPRYSIRYNKIGTVNVPS